MAGNTSRTVTLTLNANTTGSDSVKALAEEMRKLAKSGGDAAPEAEKLAKELDALAKQQNAVENLRALAESADEAKVALSKAETEAKAQGQTLQQLKGQLDKATQAEREHAAQIKAAQIARAEAKASYESARTALAQYTAEIGGAKSANAEEKKVLDEKRNSLRQLKAAYEESKSTVSSLVPEMIRLKDAVAPLTAEYNKQQREMTALAKGSEEAKQATDDLAGAIKQAEEAAKSLGVDTSKLTSEQNRLTQSMASLKTQAEGVKTAMAGPGTAAMSSAERIKQAFEVTGVRSAAALKAEILKINTALSALARESSVSGDEFTKAFVAGKDRIAELERQLKGAESAARNTGGEFGSMFRQFSIGSAAFSLVQAGISAIVSAAQGIPKVTAEFQTMNRALTIITGSSSAAAKEFKYITEIANRVGADIKGMGESYIRLTAATKDTNLAGAETKRIFEAVSGAMGVLGASSADTENAMMAVTQMVSKGVVSMEEMRQQLGERLPGAFQAVAKQLGITTADLNDLISSGQLTAEQVLPALARGLEEVYKTGQQNNTLIGQWNQFTNALKQSGNAIGDSGLLDSLMKVGRVGAAAAVMLSEGFIYAGKVIGGVAAGIRAGNLTEVLSDLADEGVKLRQRITDIGTASDVSKKSLSELAAEAKATGKDFIVTADGVKMALTAVDGLNDTMVAQQVASTKVQKQAESYETQMRKLAEATRSAGESSITAANAVGDETDKRRVATQVAADNAKALDDLLGAERLHLAILQQRKVLLDEDIAKKGQASDADKKRLDDLQKEIDKQQASVDATKKQTDANNALRDALAYEALALKDNSGQLAELRAGYEQFQQVLEKVRSEVDAGNLSKQQGAVIEEAARQQKFLYIDAVKDEQANIAALEKQKAAQFDLDTKGINVAIAKQKTLLQTAKLYGDEYGAMVAGNEIRRLEVQLSEISAKQKKAEADAILASVAAQREELRVKNQLSAAKEAELRAQELGAQAKIKEAEITQEATKQMKELYDVTLMYGNAAAQSAGDANTLANSLNNVAESAAKAGDGLNNLNGTRTALGGTSMALPIKSALYKAGATPEEAEKAMAYYNEVYQRNAATALQSVKSDSDYVTKLNRTLNASVTQALELARQEIATGKSIDLGPSVNDYMQKNMAVNGGASNAREYNQLYADAARQATGANKENVMTVVVKRNDKTIGSVQVASKQEATNLHGIIQMLENDSLRAN